jgi:hypothetical protein
MIPAGKTWGWRNSRWRADARLPAESFLLSLFTHRAAHISFHISSDTKSSLPHSAWKAPHTSAHLDITAGSSLMKCIIIAQQSSSRASAGPAYKAAMVYRLLLGQAVYRVSKFYCTRNERPPGLWDRVEESTVGGIPRPRPRTAKKRG